MKHDQYIKIVSWFRAFVFTSILLNYHSAKGSEQQKDKHNQTGIWKAIAPQNVRGAFNSHDPMGLIANSLIKADCSINWVHQDGQRYCFASGTSLVFFLKMPNGNIQRAKNKWHMLRQKRK